MQKLLINGLMAGAAVAGRQLGRNNEPVVVLFLLVGGGLMALQAIHAVAGMRAHLVFVNNRVLRARVAFGAFAGGAHERSAGLLGLRLGPSPVQEKGGEYQGERDGNCQKDRSEGHFSASRRANGVHHTNRACGTQAAEN